MSLMALGLYVFELPTAPFQQIGRQTAQRWATKDRAAGPPAAQHLGPGADQLTIDGVLMPELTGGSETLDQLRQMADEGKAWILVSGDGEDLGMWFITQVTETGSYHTLNGAPRKIEFQLSLTRYWDEDPEALGDLETSLL